MESEGSGSSSESEAPSAVPERKTLPQRASRGKRVGRLVGEVAEADAEFWGQSAFQEDETDESFSEDSSDGSSTSTDSDIDAKEPEDEEEGGGGGGGGGGGARGGGDDEEGGRKKKGASAGYVDPSLRAASTWGGGMAQIAAAAAATVAASKARAARLAAATSFGSGRPRRGAPTGDAMEVEEGAPSRSLRASTVHRSDEARAVVSAAAASPAAAAARPPPAPLPTQSEVLTEAAHTAVESLRLLDGAARVAAARASAEAAAAAAAGRGKGHVFPPAVPLLRFHSRRGAPETLTFTQVDDVPPLGSPAPPPQKPALKKCAVTGRKPNYFDPLTGQPYADLAAFRVLRARHAADAAARAAGAITGGGGEEAAQ